MADAAPPPSPSGGDGGRDHSPRRPFNRLVDPECEELQQSRETHAPCLTRIRGAKKRARHPPFDEVAAEIEKMAKEKWATLDVVATRRAQFRPPPSNAPSSSTAAAPRVVFFSGDPLSTAPREVTMRDFLKGKGFDREALYVAQMPLRASAGPLYCCPAPPPELDVLREPSKERDWGGDEEEDDGWETDEGDDDKTTRKNKKSKNHKKEPPPPPPPRLPPWRAHLWMSSPAGPHILSGPHFDDEDNLLCVLPPAPDAADDKIGNGGGGKGKGRGKGKGKQGQAAARARGAQPPQPQPQASACESHSVAAAPPRRRLGQGAKLVCLWPPELSAAMMPQAPAGEWANHSALGARDLLEEGDLFAPLLQPPPPPPASQAAAAGDTVPSPSSRPRRRSAAAAPEPMDQDGDDNDRAADEDEDGEDGIDPAAAEARRRRFRACALPATLRYLVRPGECLFIPAGWWHAVLSEPGTLAVNYWWKPPPARSAPAMLHGHGPAAPPPCASLDSEDLALRRALSTSAVILAVQAAQAVAWPLLYGPRAAQARKDKRQERKKAKTTDAARAGAGAGAATSAAAAAAAPDQQQPDGGSYSDDDTNLEREAASGWSGDEGVPAHALVAAIELPPRPFGADAPPLPPKPLCYSHPLGWTFRLTRCRDFLALSLLRAESRALGRPLLGPSPECRRVAALVCAAGAPMQGGPVECLRRLFERGEFDFTDLMAAMVSGLRPGKVVTGFEDEEQGEEGAEERRRTRWGRSAADAAAGLPPMAARVADAAGASPLAAFVLSRILDAEKAALEARRRQRERRNRGGYDDDEDEDDEDDAMGMMLWGARDEDEDEDEEGEPGEGALAAELWRAFGAEFRRCRAAAAAKGQPPGQQQQQQQPKTDDGKANGVARRRVRRDMSSSSSSSGSGSVGGGSSDSDIDTDFSTPDEEDEEDDDEVAAAKLRAFDGIMRQSRLLMRLATRAAAAGAGAM